VLCDTRDTSILIVDTNVTIPVSPKSRYTAVYRSSKKYRETAQVSRVSTIPRVSDHWATSSLQAYDAKTNVIKSLTVKHCASSSHSVTSQNFRTGTCQLVFDDPRWRGLSSRTTYLYGSCHCPCDLQYYVVWHDVMFLADRT